MDILLHTLIMMITFTLVEQLPRSRFCQLHYLSGHLVRLKRLLITETRYEKV